MFKNVSHKIFLDQGKSANSMLAARCFLIKKKFINSMLAERFFLHRKYSSWPRKILLSVAYMNNSINICIWTIITYIKWLKRKLMYFHANTHKKLQINCVLSYWVIKWLEKHKYINDNRIHYYSVIKKHKMKLHSIFIISD